MKRIWTPDQEKFLRMNYPIKGLAYCSSYLKKESAKVKAKVSNMGLKRIPGYRITEEQKDFIIHHVKQLSVSEICNQIGVKKHQIYGLCNRLGIDLADWVGFSEADVIFIKENYKILTHNQIAKAIGRSRWAIKAKVEYLGLKRTPEEAKLIRERSAKATQFCKGHEPYNTKTDFEITIRSPHRGLSYKYIRLSKAVWMPLQIFNWYQVYGPVPEGKILRSVSGDTLNCRPDNWKLIDRAEHLAENSGRNTLEDNYITNLLAHKNRGLRPIFAGMPELIELKRNQIKMRRTINELNQTSKTNR